MINTISILSSLFDIFWASSLTIKCLISSQRLVHIRRLVRIRHLKWRLTTSHLIKPLFVISINNLCCLPNFITSFVRTDVDHQFGLNGFAITRIQAVSQPSALFFLRCSNVRFLLRDMIDCPLARKSNLNNIPFGFSKVIVGDLEKAQETKNVHSQGSAM